MQHVLPEDCQPNCQRLAGSGKAGNRRALLKMLEHGSVVAHDALSRLIWGFGCDGELAAANVTDRTAQLVDS